MSFDDELRGLANQFANPDHLSDQVAQVNAELRKIPFMSENSVRIQSRVMTSKYQGESFESTYWDLDTKHGPYSLSGVSLNRRTGELEIEDPDTEIMIRGLQNIVRAIAKMAAAHIGRARSGLT